MVNTESVIPFYAQVKDDLQLRIEKGELQAGSRIPSEKELTEYYGVSTITIRRATAELVDEGVLERKQGKGTFVTRRTFRRSFRETRSFSEICEGNGMEVSTKLLKGEIVADPPAGILEKLDLRKGAHVVCITRLRYADGLPVVVETTYFPIHFAYLLETDLEHESMYATMRNREDDFALIVPPGQRLIRLESANKEIARLMNIKPGSALLRSDAVVYNEITGKPVHTSQNIGYAQKYNFTMQF